MERRPLVVIGGKTKELPPGDTLPGVGAGAGVPLFIQPTAPVGVVGAYQWIQTGLGPLGADQTIWIEDGL